MDPVDAMDHMDGRQDGRCHFTGSAVEPIIAKHVPLGGYGPSRRTLRL